VPCRVPVGQRKRADRRWQSDTALGGDELRKDVPVERIRRSVWSGRGQSVRRPRAAGIYAGKKATFVPSRSAAGPERRALRPVGMSVARAVFKLPLTRVGIAPNRSRSVGIGASSRDWSLGRSRPKPSPSKKIISTRIADCPSTNTCSGVSLDYSGVAFTQLDMLRRPRVAAACASWLLPLPSLLPRKSCDRRPRALPLLGSPRTTRNRRRWARR